MCKQGMAIRFKSEKLLSLVRTLKHRPHLRSCLSRQETKSCFGTSSTVPYTHTHSYTHTHTHTHTHTNTHSYTHMREIEREAYTHVLSQFQLVSEFLQ